MKNCDLSEGFGCKDNENTNIEQEFDDETDLVRQLEMLDACDETIDKSICGNGQLPDEKPTVLDVCIEEIASGNCLRQGNRLHLEM